MPPDIVHVGPATLQIPPLSGGAIERRMWFLGSAQAAQGASVTILAGPRATTQAGGGPPVIPLGHTSRWRFALSASRWILEREPDIVHLHSRPEIGSLIRLKGYRGLVALSFDYPLLYGRWLHALLGEYGPVLARILEHSADLFLPVSDFAATSLGTRGVKLPAPKVRVLWNGTLIGRPVEHGPYPKLRLALFVGRFVPQKGADLFAEASEELLDWEFVAIGPLGDFGDNHMWSNSRSVRLGRVAQLGPLPDEEVAAWMRRATCVVLPTRHSEAFGMVLIEALGQGTPVVAPAAEGPAEILRTAPCTHLFEPNNGASLLAAIRGSLNDDIASRCQAQDFAERFSWSRLAESSLVLYSAAKRS